jgi:mono/diheme cytochrome c family protein
MTDQRVSRPGTEWILGAAIALAAAVAAILLIASPSPATAGALYQSSGNESADLYAQQCAACHGDNGEGGVGGALTESSLPLPERIAIITNGQGGMPAYGPTLSAAQIEGLAGYLDDFAVVQIYAAQCAPCHGSAGEGGAGPNLQQSMMTDADRYSIIADGFEAMPGYSLTLSTDELQAITDYVAAFVDSSGVGEEIWTSQCAPCHGPAGEGGVAASIQEATTPFEEIVLITTNGNAGMPAYGPTLSAVEIEAVSRHVESLRTDAPEPSDPGETPPANEAGAAGYAANCAACHGVDGAGASGPALSGTSLTNEELVSVIADGVGGMPGYSATLGADEIESIAQFVADLGNAPRTEGPSPIALGAVVYGESCAVCHGVDASGASARALKDSKLTTDELESAIVDGIGGMVGFGDAITGDHLAATVAYLEARIAADAGSSESDPTTSPDATAAPDSGDSTDSSGLVDAAGGLLTGAEVYLGRCATCHGANGEGGVGSSLLNTGLDEDEIISRVYGGHEDGMPAFDGVLDPDEVRNVARYVVDLEGEDAGSGGGPGGLLAGALLVLVVGGGFWLWRSGWMSRTSRTRRARES